MNGKICSVTDGGVYYDQNPEHPLRPVEHPRTGDMYHGHPGTDFQCRCSMVMWDPEIDGDYEVKDSDLLERKEAEEKAEKDAQERAEAERQEKTRAEQEKAAEALRNAKEEARRAEAERKAAERARVEAERAAKTARATYRAAVERMGNVGRRNKSLERKMERKEAALDKLSTENARFVKFLSEYEAKRRFPDAEWEDLDGIVVAKERKTKADSNKSEKEKFLKELSIANQLRAKGFCVWLLPESSGEGKHPDSIVNGLLMDFKETNFKHAEKRFLDAFEQAGNVCLKLKERGISIERVLGKLKKHIRGKNGCLIVLLNDVVYKRDFEDIG